MTHIETDVLLVGSGLGATAAAGELCRAGYRVALVTGIGRTRSAHIDGGLVDPRVIEPRFGPGAPLGDDVSQRAAYHPAGDRVEIGLAEGVPPRRQYRRDVLEAWAMERATDAGAVYLDDFVEGKVLPRDDGSIVLTAENDDRAVVAQAIVLCEGADPRIAMRVHLRPDYGPEDQLHFARTIISGTPVAHALHGTWRTSWGMPVQVDLVPLADGTLVSLVARIENVMRASRSSKDALHEFLESPAFASLDVAGERGGTGMELVALRRSLRDLPFVHDRLVMGLDASGVIDPRRLDRADLTIAAGHHLAAYLVEHGLQLDGWADRAASFVRDAIPPPGTYHDDKASGYLEEGPARVAGRFADRIGALLGRRSSHGSGWE